MSSIFSKDEWIQVWSYRGTFGLGLLNTVETAIVGVLLSMILGIILGLMAVSGKKYLKIISRVYVELIQNTPLLLQVCFLYYALAFAGKSMGILATGMVALGIYHGRLIGFTKQSFIIRPGKHIVTFGHITERTM